jgi:hypothetical protein
MRRRLMLILAFGLLLAQATLFASFLQCEACAVGPCDDDCPPGCETCLCCSMARTVLPAASIDRGLAPVGSVAAGPTRQECAADPREIFHVPRPALS